MNTGHDTGATAQKNTVRLNRAMGTSILSLSSEPLAYTPGARDSAKRTHTRTHAHIAHRCVNRSPSSRCGSSSLRATSASETNGCDHLSLADVRATETDVKAERESSRSNAESVRNGSLNVVSYLCVFDRNTCARNLMADKDEAIGSGCVLSPVFAQRAEAPADRTQLLQR